MHCLQSLEFLQLKRAVRLELAVEKKDPGAMRLFELFRSKFDSPTLAPCSDSLWRLKP